MSTDSNADNEAQRRPRGAPRPTIRDVALRAKVAPSTVSHALSGQRTISEKTKQRIFAAIEDLGYGADPIASSLRRGSTRLVGLVLRPKDAVKGSLGGTDNFLHLIGAAATTALDQGWGLVHIPNGVDNCDTTLPVDGYIVAHPYANDPILSTLRRTRRPVVTIDAVPSDIEDGWNVSIDYASGFAQLLNHFGVRDSDSTALITGTEDNQWNRAALECMEKWAGGQNVLHSVSTLYEGEGVLGARREGKQLLQQGATRVITGSSRFAIGIAEAATSLGLSIPEDIQIASLTDSSMAQSNDPSITSVDIRLDEAGALGVKLMLTRIEDRAAPAEQTVIPEVHWRESTSPFDQ